MPSGEAKPEPLHRKVIFPFHYAPNERTVHIVARISDEPGTLASLLSTLGSKVNLIGTSSYAMAGNKAIFSGFGNLLGKRMTLETLGRDISKVPHVEWSKVWESKDGLLVDKFHVGFDAGVGEPYLMFPAKAMSETFEGVVRTFGTGGETILYDQGLAYGKSRSAIYKRIVGPHPEDRLDDLAAVVAALGYGDSRAMLDTSRRALKLTLRECFECSAQTKHGRKCSFLRGLAVGVFSGLFEKELLCEEVSCRQVGDELCEFVLNSVDHGPLV